MDFDAVNIDVRNVVHVLCVFVDLVFAALLTLFSRGFV